MDPPKKQGLVYSIGGNGGWPWRETGEREPRWALLELPQLPADLGKLAPLKSLGDP